MTSLLDLINPKIISFAVDAVIGEKNISAPAYLQPLLNVSGGISGLRQNIGLIALAILLIALLAGSCRYAFRVMNFRGQERMLKKAIMEARFKDKIGVREKRIKTENTDALIAEFRDKRGGCVSLARKELRERYKAGTDRYMIAEAFNAATKNDQQWLKWQIRKERYANSSYKKRY